MRIGIDARFWGTSTGIGRYIRELVSSMVSEGNTEFVLFLRKEDWDKASKSIHRVLADIRWYTIEEQIMLPKIFDSAGCDLLHFPHWNVPLGVRTPFVLTIHDLLLFDFPTRRASLLDPFRYALKYAGFRFVISRAIARARAIITPSEYTASKVRERFPAAGAKINVIIEGLTKLPAGPDFSFCATKGVKKPYALYVGNAYPHKNLEMAISVLGTIPGAQFVLAGHPDDFYARLRRAYSKVPNILFYGQATDAELDTLYSNAELYLFPSLEEGFGLPGLEAMERGTPVLSADSGALPEVYGDAASYFDPKSAHDLKETLDRLLGSREMRLNLSQKGRQRAALFSWKRAAQETLSVYKTIL